MEWMDSVMAVETQEWTLRLLASLILSGAIGYERESKAQAAGLRTHMLAGIGACLFTLLMMQMVGRFGSDGVQADPIRIVSAIASSVAFIAAGAIIQSRGEVRGLTTGASLWLTGAVGLSCGLGEYALALIAVVLTIIVLRLVRIFEKRYFGERPPQ